MASSGPHANGTLSISLPNEEKDEHNAVVESPVSMTATAKSVSEGNGSIESSGSDQEEDEEEDQSSDGSEESDDEDEEPALKYERIGGSIPNFLKKDSGSALAVSNSVMAMGTHAGFVHMLDMTGQSIRSIKPHVASVIDICMDETAEWVATASLDGQVRVYSTAETFAFDLKRPMRAISLEPNFAKRSTRAFVCGGMAGNLILYERGWLGHKDTILHTGEGPIWAVKWRGRLIAWANDLGVKIYDTVSQTRITFIDRPSQAPRADLFKCTLHWQDDSTLLIAWADHIKVARVRARPRTQTSSAASAGLPPLLVEITLVLKVDCMIAGLVPHPHSMNISSPTPSISSANPAHPQTQTQTHYLLLAYTPPDMSIFSDEPVPDRAQQARKLAERPELRIISPGGAELAADALSVSGYEDWGCNDYVLAEASATDDAENRTYVVLSPRDIVVVRRRDRRDHIAWLVERKRYEEALSEVERLEAETGADGGSDAVSAVEIGQRYIEHLVNDGNFAAAARLTPKVCGRDVNRWENWIFLFQQKRQMQAIIPYVPTDSPRLDHLIYEMILAHFLSHDRTSLLQTIKEWPKDIYDISAVIVAVLAELDRTASTSNLDIAAISADKTTLMECLAELYVANRQPGKALTYLLRLRRPNVFELIRENNLFTDVQDQALQLVEFDHELMEKRKPEGQEKSTEKSEAIQLLVDHIHAIPIGRVVAQLQSRPYFLFLYLDALMEKESHMVSEFADVQVKLYAEFATPRLIDFLRASNEYNLENAYRVCEERSLVPEMVFLLGRMGNNRQALTLIIERLGDVNRAIDFAKEQNDDDLWEDLLRYSETRPAFIRGLLENVGAEISPIRLIRRIKNGLEIPGLQASLVKILQDFHLQISLLEGCQTIMNGDSSDYARKLQKDQSAGFLLTGKSICPMCTQPLVETHQRLVILFLCRHVVHASCTSGGDRLPPQPDPVLRGAGMADSSPYSVARGINGKIAFEAVVRAKLDQGCPVCHEESEGAVLRVRT